MDTFEGLTQTLREEIPGFRIGYKDESRTQRLVGGFLASVGSSRYLTDFTTVLPSVSSQRGAAATVWFPTRSFVAQDPERAARVLLHERVHLHDLRDQPLVFVASYLTTHRAHWERRAYAVDIVLSRRRGLPYDHVLNWLVGVFTGPDYLYMWPDPRAVQGWVAHVWREGLDVELTGALAESTGRWIDRMSS